MLLLIIEKQFYVYPYNLSWLKTLKIQDESIETSQCLKNDECLMISQCQTITNEAMAVTENDW